LTRHKGGKERYRRPRRAKTTELGKERTASRQLWGCSVWRRETQSSPDEIPKEKKGARPFEVKKAGPGAGKREIARGANGGGWDKQKKTVIARGKKRKSGERPRLEVTKKKKPDNILLTGGP